MSRGASRGSKNFNKEAQDASPYAKATQIVLTLRVDAGTDTCAPVRKWGSGCGEQKWKAQPYISPEPNPDASLVSFCASRKKLALARAKRFALLPFCFFTERNGLFSGSKSPKSL